jgi:CDP-diacylglycerol pyrophosphatase
MAGVTALVLVGAVTGSIADHTRKSDALWRIVHEACVPNQEKQGDPAPCTLVNLKQGYALLKDKVGKTQYLLVPTARISGIESASLLAGDTPNYWKAAWDSRAQVSQRLGRTLPRDAIGMAVNSAFGRSQNQLHIHIDCVASDVRAQLRAHLSAIGPRWASLPFHLDGHPYRARRVDSASLQGVNPFVLLAQDAQQSTVHDMKRRTLAVVGVVFEDGSDGFILLTDTADVLHGDLAHGEELLDHACTAAREP